MVRSRNVRLSLYFNGLQPLTCRERALIPLQNPKRAPHLRSLLFGFGFEHPKGAQFIIIRPQFALATERIGMAFPLLQKTLPLAGYAVEFCHWALHRFRPYCLSDLMRAQHSCGLAHSSRLSQ